MKLDTWHISGAGFHFGAHGFGQEESRVNLPSDSLFAALVYRLALREGAQAVESYLAPFHSGEAPYVISSTFPRAGNLLFFPAPFRREIGERGSGPQPKELKRVNYLSLELFRRLLAGESFASLYPGSRKLQKETVLCTPEEAAALPQSLVGDTLWEVEKRPRVTLDRASSASNLYFTGRVIFARDCGLWFGVRWIKDDQKQYKRLVDLLADLADAGLGGERSAGYGAAQILPVEPLELPEPDGNTWVSLSRYLPAEDELAALRHPQAAYRLEHVGGWLDSPHRRGQRRRGLHILSAGSTFGPLERSVPGSLADVRPVYESDPDPLGHPVYRAGLALAVAYQGGEA
jgi:CRISPR-associated protein Csm4